MFNPFLKNILNMKTLSSEIIKDYLKMRENNISIPALKPGIHPIQKVISDPGPIYKSKKQLVTHHKKDNWTVEENQMLKKMISLPNKFIAAKLNRTVASVRHRKKILSTI